MTAYARIISGDYGIDETGLAQRLVGSEAGVDETSPAPLGADLSITLDAVALSADASVALQADLSKTLSDVTLSADVSIPGQLDLSKTLDAITLSADASAALQADLAKTLDNITLSSSIVLPLIADLSLTLDPVTLAATVGAGLQADLAVTLDGVRLSSSIRVFSLGKQRWLIRTAIFDQLGHTSIDDLQLTIKRGVGTYDEESYIALRVNRDNKGFGRAIRRSLGRAGDTFNTIRFGGLGSAFTWQFEFEATENVEIELQELRALVSEVQF